jgi:nitrate reductase gamma subunit
MRSTVSLIVLGMLLVLSQSAALSCPTCYGDPDSPMTQGLNSAIALLLGVTSAVLAGVSGIFLIIRRRTQEVNRRLKNLLNEP